MRRLNCVSVFSVFNLIKNMKKEAAPMYTYAFLSTRVQSLWWSFEHFSLENRMTSTSNKNQHKTLEETYTHMLSSSKIERNPEKTKPTSTFCNEARDISNKRWRTRFGHNNNGKWKIDGKLKMCNTMILSLCWVSRYICNRMFSELPEFSWKPTRKWDRMLIL